MVSGIYLSDEELSVFGVVRFKGGNGRVRYIVPCDMCGEKIETTKYNTNNVYKCSQCASESKAMRNRIIEMAKWRNRCANDYQMGISYEHFHRFENATKKFDKSYSDDIEKAREYADTFDSIPEVVACIELLHIGAKVISHQEIKGYTVDFCLPKEKLVIEIDGSLYHKDEKKEYWRDCAIKSALGDDWEVKHIPAEAVTSNHKFFGRCMSKLLDDRRFELKKQRRSKMSDAKWYNMQ